VQVTALHVRSPDASACPFVLLEVCETCWKFHGVITEKNGKHHGSQDRRHDWEKFSTFLLLPSRKTVGSIPKQFAENHKFVMCRHAGKKRGCTYRYHSGRHCKFAHSSEENEVWKWMLNNEGKKILYCYLYPSITVSAKNKVLLLYLCPPSMYGTVGYCYDSFGLHQPVVHCVETSCLHQKQLNASGTFDLLKSCRF